MIKTGSANDEYLTYEIGSDAPAVTVNMAPASRKRKTSARDLTADPSNSRLVTDSEPTRPRLTVNVRHQATATAASTTAPAAKVYSNSGHNTSYLSTFCPNGSIASLSGVIRFFQK